MAEHPEPPARNDLLPSGYPPPPWRARGALWISVLRTRDAMALPDDLMPVDGRHALVAVLVRYTEGALRYDEFAVGSLVRRGRYAGLFCHRIWVDSVASLRGGRQLWGIPKELARFSWSEGTVRIDGEAGPVATLRVGPDSRGRIPVSRVPGVGFGQIDEDRTLLVGRIAGRLGTSRITPIEWHEGLPALSSGRPRRALSVSQARFFFPPGRRVGRAGAQAPEGRT